MVSNASHVTPNLHRKPSSLRYYQEGLPDVPPDWCLTVTGLVERTLRIPLSELRALGSVEESRRMVCVCNWSIRRAWSGVTLEEVIRLAGVRSAGGLYVRQTSIGTTQGGVYESTVPLQPALDRRALLIHSVDGGPLPLEQGYPLRFFDFGLYGYKNVKGLQSLDITDKCALGEWEKRAGYDVDGTIRTKKYWFVDLSGFHFVARAGEVIDQ